ncbi:MAG: Tim44 domain-containing protein [Magnetococcales bacterium]|nr:Tim44 domain-containing protein [Magnetococcales bacterium]
MNRTAFLSFCTAVLTAGLALATFWPEDADARAGGGQSTGSRGSRSFSTPRQTTPAPSSSPMRQSTPAATAPTAPTAPAAAPHVPAAAPPALPAASGMGAGLLGGLGGLALGGLLGAALFGGGSGGAADGAANAAANAASSAGGVGGSGIGLLEIVLIGGLIWFALRWFRQQKERSAAPMGAYGRSARSAAAEPFLGKPTLHTSPGQWEAGSGGDDRAQGLANIASMDPNFDETRFLEGAKMAFQHIQGAWSDWSVERLRPLLTERMWGLIQAQAMERKAAGKRDIIEKIRFEQVEISEAWQEAGEDWLTVHFLVDMVDYTTDLQGNVLEGDPQVSARVEEYWTFNRPVGSREPGWFLSAIQQPGEVAKSVI